MLSLNLSTTAAQLLAAAIVAVAGDGNGNDPRVQRLLRFVADEHGHPLASAPPPDDAVTPARLAAAIPEPEARTAANQRLLLAAMLIPPFDAERFARLHEYAVALECADDPAIADLRMLVAGQHRRLSGSLMRRFPPSERIRIAWRRGPWSARWRFIKAMLRLPDRHTATRYAALGELPRGTLGREFFEHCRSNGFPLPGERGGVPEPIVFHDMGHALVGKTTSIDDEVYMGAFEAGCFGDRAFTMIEFALLLFNLGAKLPTDAKPAVGAVDVDILLDAYVAGRRARFDVLHWEPWADVHEGVAALRTRYGIDASTRESP